MLARWPGHIPAGGRTGEFMTSEDRLPTLMSAAGDPDVKQKLLQGERVGEETFKVHLDGYDQTDMLARKGPSRRHEFLFYGDTDLNAFRVDQWKVHVAIKKTGSPLRRKFPAACFFDIKLDPVEMTSKAPGHFDWMAEKTWIAPVVAPALIEFEKSMKEFPPRQEGAGVDRASLPASWRVFERSECRLTCLINVPKRYLHENVTTDHNAGLASRRSAG
jgi:arylsulfatase